MNGVSNTRTSKGISDARITASAPPIDWPTTATCVVHDRSSLSAVRASDSQSAAHAAVNALSVEPCPHSSGARTVQPLESEPEDADIFNFDRFGILQRATANANQHGVYDVVFSDKSFEGPMCKGDLLKARVRTLGDWNAARSLELKSLEESIPLIRHEVAHTWRQTQRD